MIRFDATIEILLCLSGALVVGVLVGWFLGSFLIGTAVMIGLFCFLVDVVFSFEAEDDGEWDDDSDY